MPGVRQAGGVAEQRVVAVWRDGGAVAVPADAPVVTAFDQGLGRGDGAFESVAVVDRGTPHLAAHLQRLRSSARLLELPDPGDAVWRALLDAVLADWPADLEGVCRLFLTRGLGEGMPPTALALLAPVPPETLRQRAEGISVVSLGLGVPAAFRAEAPWLLGGAKTLSYAVNMAALRHAERHGAGDVIFVGSDGYILEGPRSTVVIAAELDGSPALLTPPPWFPILRGTTQQALFEVARNKGYDCDYRALRLADLVAAQGVWLVSSITLAARVHTLDGKALPAAPLAAEVAGLVDAAIICDR
jgi:4-amino-4-deoxychorismate lyase